MISASMFAERQPLCLYRPQTSLAGIADIAVSQTSRDHMRAR